MPSVVLVEVNNRGQEKEDPVDGYGKNNLGFESTDVRDTTAQENEVRVSEIKAGDVEIEAEEEKLFTYDVYENPPIPLALLFSLQQMLMSLSRSLTTSLLVADILCARADETFKAKLLSTTLFLSGMCTFLQNTVGIRLPLYQGPAATYVVPLLALQGLQAWACPGDVVEGVEITANQTASFDSKMSKLMGSLMIAGALHMLVGVTGVVGLLMKLIGPVSIVPALTINALYVYSATVKFCKVQWGVAYLTVAVAFIMSFYMRHLRTPVPYCSRKKGCGITWFPFHKVFSVLIVCMVGWSVSAIITAAGGFSANNIYARTDSRMEVIHETPWFFFPYPGQFGSPTFDTGAFVTFLLGTIGSIIDSIGDYYACANVVQAPPPPSHAVNRGLAVEGMMSFFAGWTGASHATSTFGGNIGAIGFTRVASLRVFQLLGLLFIVFGVVGKVGAVFVTIPYSVVGGLQMINFGVLIGVMMANLQFLDMNSTRNTAIIGLAMLMSLMMPHWVKTTENPIDTGMEKLDDTLKMLLANPLFIAMVVACFLDNTVPGTREERGMIAWQAELGLNVEAGDKDGEVRRSKQQIEREMKVRKVVYILPYIGRFLKNKRWTRFIPFCPQYHDD